MSEEERNLRRFPKATSMTAPDYVQRLLVVNAQELLQFGNTLADSVG